jgi:hypothetical protein
MGVQITDLQYDVVRRSRGGCAIRKPRIRLGFATFTAWFPMLVQPEPREHSPSTNNGPPTKKRKHNPPSHNSAADSPAPSDPSSLSNPTATENVVLPTSTTSPRDHGPPSPARPPSSPSPMTCHTTTPTNSRTTASASATCPRASPPRALPSPSARSRVHRSPTAVLPRELGGPQPVCQSYPGWPRPARREGLP